ncbi:MAG: site-specific DNA-methyltransferase [Anaerolineales bacterium]|nr:site-specific DNA-methyltransferase [Anaerolineales bacterium]WKZ41697.1 MAG: site-specific DNA-methyltransferase [Anaerolineales bacterium]
MPTLNWIGKDAVINHHKEVPFRLLKCRADLSVGDPDSGNLLVQGDNLEALKALLPYYAGQVKCIYIDPPYNTGNEGWVYNDNVNSPEMREWLGKVVGGEAEDLSRHDKWLSMMYPRLVLLHQMLREDGMIFINLDDNEAAHLKVIMDEIFKPQNFIASISWEKRYTRSNNAKLFYSLKDVIVAYRKSDKVSFLREPRNEKSDSIYSNPDNDPRGVWTSSSYVNPATKSARPNLVYTIINPNNGKKINHPSHAWKYEQSQHEIHITENRLWWGKDGNAKYPRLKVFLNESNTGLVPVDIWKHEDSGTTDEGGNEVKQIFGKAVFDNPKPTKLIRRIIKLTTSPGDIILDSFAGSGTTGHAILRENADSESERKFILIEMDKDISKSITSERLQRVINGYGNVEGLGGGFRYCELGATLFDPNRQIRAEVKYNDLAGHVYFVETGQPLPERLPKSRRLRKSEFPLLGVHNGTAVYLLYNGILKDKSVNGGNVLTYDVLEGLPAHDGQKVIYGNGSRISKARLNDLGIVFKQIPYEIREM